MIALTCLSVAVLMIYLVYCLLFVWLNVRVVFGRLLWAVECFMLGARVWLRVVGFWIFDSLKCVVKLQSAISKNMLWAAQHLGAIKCLIFESSELVNYEWNFRLSA
jgi:hypothetical protein